jgi:3-ketosteroid 9alpha-monooxygenase subunit A
MPRFPFPPFPNSWFQVAYSDELAVGAVLPLRYFGRELVAFRGEDGVARVLDAYCAHLGAHLGVGGAVQGNVIRCPFHAWCFDGSGTCVEIPYAKRIPPKARIQAWHVCEQNGLIMVWHDMEGRPPQFELPRVPEYGHEDWTDYKRLRWRIKSHNQEMAENAVDRAHFRYVHRTVDVPESKAEVDGHILRVVSKAQMRTPRGDMDGEIASTSYGFGFSTTRFSGIVETLLVASVTPIDVEDLDVRFSFTVRKIGDADITRGVGKALVSDITKQMGEDKPIWENKIYQPRPVLCDGDGPIAVFRNWCTQFYSADATAAASESAGVPSNGAAASHA